MPRAGQVQVIMFAALPAYFLAVHCIGAQPIPAIDCYRPSSCDDIDQGRSVWNIVWSCVATILSCTWVALHPNIPNPEVVVTLRRVKITGMALLTPELVVMWAMRQWFVARRLAEKNKSMSTVVVWLVIGMLISVKIMNGRGLTVSLP